MLQRQKICFGLMGHLDGKQTLPLPQHTHLDTCVERGPVQVRNDSDFSKGFNQACMIQSPMQGKKKILKSTWTSEVLVSLVQNPSLVVLGCRVKSKF